MEGWTSALRRWIHAVAFGLAASFALACCAATTGGVDAGSFARDGVGARAWGLGGAFVAIAEGHSAGYWNAAALSRLDGIDLGGMMTDRFGLGIAFQSYSIAFQPVDSIGVELGLVRSSIDDIPFSGDEGAGYFSESQNLFQAALGYEVLEGTAASQTGSRHWLCIGTAAKAYSHNLLDGRGRGIGLDVSVLAGLSLPWGTLQAGWSAQDALGTDIHWSGTDHNPIDRVPAVHRVGASAVISDGLLVLATEVDWAASSEDLGRLRLGLEWTPVPVLSTRIGVVLSQSSLALSYGGAVRRRGLSIDYAYVPHTALGGSHIFSVTLTMPRPEGE